MINLRKYKRVFPLVIMIFLILLHYGRPVYGDLIFTPHNHQFALYNTQLRAVTVPLVFVRNRNIVGSTGFSDNTSSYIGFLTAQDQGSTRGISFNYFTWSNDTGWNNLKSLQKILLFTDDKPQLWMVGLSCD